MRNLDYNFRLKNNARNDTLERSWLADICLRFMEKIVGVEVSLKKAEGQEISIEAVGEGVRRNLPMYQPLGGGLRRFWGEAPIDAALDQGKRRPYPGSQAQRVPVLVSLGYTGQEVWEAKRTYSSEVHVLFPDHVWMSGLHELPRPDFSACVGTCPELVLTIDYCAFLGLVVVKYQLTLGVCIASLRLLRCWIEKVWAGVTVTQCGTEESKETEYEPGLPCY